MLCDKITDISDFSEINTDKGDICFLRCIGHGASYIKKLAELDGKMLSAPDCVYKRLTALERPSDPAAVAYYTEKYGMNTRFLKNTEGAEINSAFAENCRKIFALIRQGNPSFSATMEKNTAVTLMYRTDLYLTEMLSNAGGKRRKLVVSGKTGVNEYAFCYLAALFGIDVLLLLPSGDVKLPPVLLNVSRAFSDGEVSDIDIPEFKGNASVGSRQSKINLTRPNTKPSPKIDITRPDTYKSAGKTRVPAKERRELSYEELAALAPSVVRINVADEDGDNGSGSGIIINSRGYILTNCHVTSHGTAYTVQLENDSGTYDAKIIKYHPLIDLAVIRIDRAAAPLKVYSGPEELKRGQKVVAIGSPLGMFNSVSDGIISGFREMDGTDMIQFTAPVSFGSSGGALLNMYGEVIGISAVVLVGGQNMNFAVKYNHINDFIKGFI